MGFGSSSPKPSPALTGLQASQTEEAKRQRIDLLSQQLDEETRVRLRRFGMRSMLGGFGGAGASSSMSGGATLGAINLLLGGS